MSRTTPNEDDRARGFPWMVFDVGHRPGPFPRECSLALSRQVSQAIPLANFHHSKKTNVFLLFVFGLL